MERKFGVPYRDMSKVPEDDRIRMIAEAAHRGERIGVLVDDEPEKIARYKAKLTARGCAIAFEAKGPTKGAYTLTVTAKVN